MDHLRYKSEQTAAAYVAGELDPRSMEDFELHMMSCPECVEAVEGWRVIKDQLGREALATRRALDAAETEALATPGVLDAPEPEALATAEALDHLNRIRHDRPKLDRPRLDRAGLDHRRLEYPPGSRSARREGPQRHPSISRSAALRWRLASMITLGLLAGAGGGWYLRSAQGPSIDGRNIGFYDLPAISRGPADCLAVNVGSSVALVAVRVPGALASEQLVAVGGNGRDLPPDGYSVSTQGDGSWLVRLEATTVRAQPVRFEARSADGTVEPRGCVTSAPAS